MTTYWFNHHGSAHTIVEAGDIREAIVIAESQGGPVRDGYPVTEAEILVGIGDGNRRILDLRDGA